MDVLPTLDNLAPEYNCLIGAYLPPQCLSHFRTVNLVHRHALQLTLVEVLACSGVAGLETIPKIAGKGNADAITAVAARLEDADGNVRSVAVYVLGEIVEKGNADAITVVSARLEHANGTVREAAVNVLAQITQKGNPNVITAMRALLEDAQPEVRAAALSAGLLIAEDITVITERYEALEHARFELS